MVFFVKEGFSSELVVQAMNTDGVKKNDLLIDPFSGSGTVSLAGAMASVRTLAFEVNPFLHFLSATKLRSTERNGFISASDVLRRSLKESVSSPLEGYSTFTKGNRWNRWLFPRSVLRAFEAGRRATNEIRSPSRRALLNLALIGAAMDCCNASRDGKCLRYHKDWVQNQATVSLFADHFQNRAKMMASDLRTVPLRCVGNSVIEGDSRKLISKLNEKFRICVTSPPYLNSFDYSDIYRPELFLGGFVKSTEELRKIRLKTIRSHVQVAWKDPKTKQFGSVYDVCASKLREQEGKLWDDRLPTMVQAYFEDMEHVLSGLRGRARRNASLWMVVSTSAYAGVEVPVDLIIAEIGQRAGWLLREVGVLRYLRSSSQHVEHVNDERKSVPLRESVVIFDACARQGCN